MTTISKMELIDRFEKRLIETKEEHNKLVKSLNKHNNRILKNLNIYNELELSPLKIQDSLNELVDKLNQNIRLGKVELIAATNVKIEEVFELFYNCEPPFSNKEKKRFEFPDAFILKSVDGWCKKKRKKMIFLSHDKDFNGYKSRHLQFRDDPKKLLAEISEYYDSLQTTQIIPFINDQILNNKKDLEEMINNKLEDLISFDIDFERITGEQFKGTISGKEITAIRPNHAEVSCNISIDYGFTILPSEYDISKEIFEESIRPKKIKNSLITYCELEVGLNRPNDIKLKWINLNQRIRISVNN